MRPYSSSTTSTISSIEAGSATSVVTASAWPPALHDLGGHAGCGLFIALGDHGARRRRRKGLGEDAADALAGAGDDGDAVLERGKYDVASSLMPRPVRAAHALPARCARPTASTTA